MANILTKEIGGSSSKYPEKRSINLNEGESHAEKNVTAVVVFAIFIVALAFFTKFFVIDRINEVNSAEATYNDMLRQISLFEQEDSKYEQVRTEYSHYGSVLNDLELSLQDRMAMLEVIEKVQFQNGVVTNVSITGNTAALTIMSQNLADVSAVVSDIQENDIVSYVTVSTANTENQNSNAETDTDKTVISTMTIYFKSPVTDETAENGSSDGTDAENGSSDGTDAEDGSSDGTDADSSSAGNTDQTGTSSDAGDTETSSRASLTETPANADGADISLYSGTAADRLFSDDTMSDDAGIREVAADA